MKDRPASLFLACLSLLSLAMLAGCGEDAPISPAVVAEATVASTAPSEISYHGRPLGEWRERARDRQDVERRCEAVDSLAAMAREGHADETLPDLVAALEDRQNEVVRAARAGLVSLLPKSLVALKSALRSDQPEVRAQAALTIEEIGAPAAELAPTLVEALADRDSNVRECAMLALTRLGESALAPLADALKHEQPRIREYAARVLRDLGPAAKPAVPALLEAVHDHDPDVHAAAASALFKIDREAAEAAGVK